MVFGEDSTLKKHFPQPSFSLRCRDRILCHLIFSNSLFLIQITLFSASSQIASKIAFLRINCEWNGIKHIFSDRCHSNQSSRYCNNNNENTPRPPLKPMMGKVVTSRHGNWKASIPSFLAVN